MLSTQCKVLCRPAHIAIKSEGRENSSADKKRQVSVREIWLKRVRNLPF